MSNEEDNGVPSKIGNKETHESDINIFPVYYKLGDRAVTRGITVPDSQK
jgi:hypothetical protein